jgi:hypothetical protein
LNIRIFGKQGVTAMKMTFVGRLLPFTMGKITNKYLSEYYSVKEIRKIVTSAKADYKAIVKRTPDMGGKANIMLANMFIGAYLIALYRQVRDKISLEAFGKIIEDGCRDLAAKRSAGFDFFGEDNRKRFNDGMKWADENGEKYPWIWQFKLFDDKERDGVRIVFTRCGLCKLCAAEGLPELTSLLCATDYMTAEMMGVKLEREKMLSTGDDCCDFLYLKN